MLSQLPGALRPRLVRQSARWPAPRARPELESRQRRVAGWLRGQLEGLLTISASLSARIKRLGSVEGELAV